MKNDHILAFKGLTLSLIDHGRKYIETQNNIDNLPKERRKQIQTIRKMRFTRKTEKQKKIRETHGEHAQYAEELLIKSNRILESLDSARLRFAQQIEDSIFSGYTEMAERNAQRFMYLETKGVAALMHLHEIQKETVETKYLSALIEHITKIQIALREQLDWRPSLMELVQENNFQYRTIFQPA